MVQIKAILDVFPTSGHYNSQSFKGIQLGLSSAEYP